MPSSPDTFKDAAGRRVLVAGGTGLIGRPLVELLLEAGARVRVASLDDPSRADPRVEFCRLDLLDFHNCLKACDGMDWVFNLLGVKGSPAATRTRPASFLVPTTVFSLNLMEAARQCKAGRFLFTSSVGAYGPAEVFKEDELWDRPPSPHDRFAGWAKRMGELQAEAYRIEFGWDKIAIVRPANVYGPFDNFDLENAMVVPSLIRRAVSGENPLVVWGDGSPRRDFIFARDVARGMLLAMIKMPDGPVNLGSGAATSIRELAEAIAACVEPRPKLVWDPSKPSGDALRVMDIARARAMGFSPAVGLPEGIAETVAWYRENAKRSGLRHDVFRPGGAERLLP